MTICAANIAFDRDKQMTFTVIYRDKDGSLREDSVEATGRAECFAKCRARGIAPVGVEESAPGKPGGGSRRVPCSKGRSGKSRSGRLRLLAILVALLAAIGGACWWLGRGKASSPAKRKPRATERIPEYPSRPVVANSATNAPAAEESKIAETEDKETKPKPFNPNEPPPGLLPNEPWRSGRKKVHKVQYVSRNENKIYRNATEQALLDIFSCEVGDPPLPLTNLPKDEISDIMKILQSPNPITEKDVEDTKLGKEILEATKKELLKYVKEGGNPDDFLSYYHGILEKAYKKRMVATEEIYKVLNEQNDPEIAREMLKRVNRELREEGIRPLPIPISAFQ